MNPPKFVIRYECYNFTLINCEYNNSEDSIFIAFNVGLLDKVLKQSQNDFISYGCLKYSLESQYILNFDIYTYFPTVNNLKTFNYYILSEFLKSSARMFLTKLIYDRMATDFRFEFTNIVDLNIINSKLQFHSIHLVFNKCRLLFNLYFILNDHPNCKFQLCRVDYDDSKNGAFFARLTESFKIALICEDELRDFYQARGYDFYSFLKPSDFAATFVLPKIFSFIDFLRRVNSNLNATSLLTSVRLLDTFNKRVPLDKSDEINCSCGPFVFKKLKSRYTISFFGTSVYKDHDRIFNLVLDSGLGTDLEVKCDLILTKYKL